MPATPKFYWRQPVSVPGNEGGDSWGSFAKVRKSSAGESNQMPPGYEPQAKNAFGKKIADGNVTAEDADCGYCEYDKPTYGDRSYGDTE
jgi:hypothetical protein